MLNFQLINKLNFIENLSIKIKTALSVTLWFKISDFWTFFMNFQRIYAKLHKYMRFYTILFFTVIVTNKFFNKRTLENVHSNWNEKLYKKCV